MKKLWSSVKTCYLAEAFAPDRSFLTIKAFWVPLLIGLIGFCLLCLKISIDEQLVFNLEAKLEDMYKLFKIPLWWLALLIPVLGLLNANHKSEQTKASMELTKAQNNFVNYYKHLEEFSKFATNASKEYESSVKTQTMALHSKLFPNADKGDYKIFSSNGSVPHAAYELVRLTIQDVRQIKNEHVFAPGEGALRKQSDYILFLKDYFVFEGPAPDGVFTSDNDDEALICPITPNEIDWINEIYVMLKLLDKIVMFDAKSEPPNKDFHITYKNAFLAIWSSFPLAVHSQ